MQFCAKFCDLLTEFCLSLYLLMVLYSFAFTIIHGEARHSNNIQKKYLKNNLSVLQILECEAFNSTPLTKLLDAKTRKKEYSLHANIFIVG